MVTNIHAQAGNMAALAAQMSGLIQESAKRVPSQPTYPLSRFASLIQGLRGGATGIPPTVLGSADPSLPDLVCTVKNLQTQVKDFSTKLGGVSKDKGSYCIPFENAGFRNPRDVLSLIKAQMPTSYFGCFVNAAILLEWILGNSGEDALKKMERMTKLKIPSLAEVHSLKGYHLHGTSAHLLLHQNLQRLCVDQQVYQNQRVHHDQSDHAGG
jgi:hypothetical protein